MTVDGDTRSVKMQRLRPRANYLGTERKLKCTRCGAVMPDCEPCGIGGEFRHPRNACPNAGKVFDWDRPTGKLNKAPAAVGIIQLAPKRHQRARKRGARSAAKHRPR